MVSGSKGDDRVAIIQLNAELRNAQLEMLSAECATGRLRLRFSPEDIARYGERSALRKAVASATALKEYFSSVSRQVSDPDEGSALTDDESKIAAAMDRMRQYLRDQREEYRPQGLPLSAHQCDRLEPFFPAILLAEIRIVVLRNQRIPNPSFYAEADALGIADLPELTHMPSLTFEDVVIFPGEINDRRLFHALVHTVQFKVLGVERYTELFVRSFLRTRSHVRVPLEMHAFTLEAKFAEHPKEPFSVEEQVRLWTNQGRYGGSTPIGRGAS